jgi:hypothetical protein
MRWTYRIAGGPERQAFTTSVLEERPGQTGVFRVRTELDDGIAVTRLMTVTADGVCSLPEVSAVAGPRTNRRMLIARVEDTATAAPQSRAWQVEIRLPADQVTAGADGVWETVKVPAGEFRTVRTTRSGASGEPIATVWLAPGVGMVRREWGRGGVVEELEAFHRPVSPEGGANGTGHSQEPVAIP